MTAHAALLELAHELVDDIELARLGPDQLILKAMRLARLAEDDTARAWLQWEINGYPNAAKPRAQMLKFGRLQEAGSKYGYWQPLAGILATIAAMQAEIQSLRIPSINFAPSSANPSENVTGFAGFTAQAVTKPAHDTLQRLQVLTNAVSLLSSVRSKVLGAVHEFAVSHYHKLAFEALAEGMFERYRNQVDEVLARDTPDALEKIPAVYERLADRDPEAISQAMNSVRRVIKAVVDRLYPPAEGSVEVDGKSYEIGSDKVLNRLDLFLRNKCSSRSRRERLTKSLRAIHDRASTGAHTEISAQEARSLFLQSYLLLGEVLTLA